MGVTGLWTIVQPCARPTRLETLNKHRLAVDASIWIYQFLKAVRDKEGNALRNSHVVGFFRRLCKLLYYGIKPVFVFDGGAPALKRQTVLGRKKRREGRREDAVRTAGKLLAIQMQRAGEEEEARRKREIEVRGRPTEREEEEEISERDLVYVDEFGMSAQEREKSRKFTKKDAYHLPELSTSLENMGQPNDPRVMSAEELEEYARQFNSGEEINLYDFSKIDFDGDFFCSLPISDRYNILNAARLRSRLRMGYTKEQLEEMFPDRMEYSRFQIERVAQRNDLTQRLMNLTGMNDNLGGSGRIAGESNREYMLVKNDGVEGGWVLGVVSTDKEVGQRNKPIDIDALDRLKEEETRDIEEDDEFEDVPVEGLNRLPKLQGRKKGLIDVLGGKEAAEERRRFYSSKKQNTGCAPSRVAGEEESLFVEQDDTAEAEAISKSVDDIFDDEEADLNRAIAMSLEKQHGKESDGDDDVEFEDVQMPQWEQRAVEEPKPITTSSGRMVAHIVNNRANAAVPKRKAADDESSDDDMDLTAALAASRKQQKLSKDGPGRRLPAPTPSNVKNPFDGPLPFEKLDFKTSLFGKKAADKPIDADNLGQEEDDEMAGGFERDDSAKAKPLPPWLAGSGDIRSDYKTQQDRDREVDAEDRRRALEEEEIFRRNHGIIQVDSSDDEDSDVEVVKTAPVEKSQRTIDLTTGSITAEESTLTQVETAPVEDVETAGDLAESTRASPPQTDTPQNRQPSLQQNQEVMEAAEADSDEPIEWSDSDREDPPRRVPDPSHPAGGTIQEAEASRSPSPEFEDIDIAKDGNQNKETAEPAVSEALKERSISPEFEDVTMPDTFSIPPAVETVNASIPPSLPIDESFARKQAEIIDGIDFDEFSDPEDEELLANLAAEAEEHARFASTLNNKSAEENAAAYEAELKALRNQQKKDRRDADEVTQIMIQECQALLRYFGIPYITAPMEAEAQCAELLSLGLVDGIVTDDSDILLFGGTRIYKNMFSKGVKDVECYLSSDIEKEMSLSRHSLIQIAHLLGSDYTEGLPGIGPVTAVEILSEFPSENGLQEFRDWWDDVQVNSRPKEVDMASPFRRKFRRSQGKKLFLPPAFPSPAVTEAYLKPDVDSTPEPFQWGVPDLDNIRSFLMSTIGWGPERADEVLVPVIKAINQREAEGTQSNITRFFTGGIGAGARQAQARGQNVGQSSSRMNAAVQRLKGKKKNPLATTFGGEAREWAEREGERERRERAKTVERGSTVEPTAGSVNKANKRTRKRTGKDNPEENDKADDERE
jgi:DNA excision repair protein ERCC-5